jgi:CBS domain-containing protein
MSNVQPPVVRLRVRRVERVRLGGDRITGITVFCPGQRRSLDLESCRRCHRLASAAEDSIVCAPPEPEPTALALVSSARLGGDACVGDAMGPFAVVVDADVSACAAARSLQASGVVVAIVVDEWERLVGLLDRDDGARTNKSVLAGGLARRVNPVHESAPLVHAIDRMVHERNRALPVVGDEGCVVALLTDLDALNWVAHRTGSRS